MFVRVTHMEIASNDWNEAVQRFQTSVVSELEKQPGFLRTILTGDANAGKATAITMWQSAAHESSVEPDPVFVHLKELVGGNLQTSGYPQLFEREF